MFGGQLPPSTYGPDNTYVCRVLSILAELDEEEVWDESSSDELQGDSSSSPALPEFISSAHESQRACSLMMWLLGYILTIQAKYYIPNAAIDAMLKFLYIFFSILSRFSPFFNPILEVFPKSLYSLYKLVHYEDSFNKFVVCPKCETIYAHEQCFENIGSQRRSKNCSKVKYPNHPFVTGRAPCQCILLKTVQFTSGRKLLYPFKLYCYKSVQSTLQSFLLRPDFYSNCQKWRTRPDSPSLSEIYDGKVWQEFQDLQHGPFLSGECTIAFSLNVDWFQPFTHTVYSVGVIYLSILNLPRNFRYKTENLIIVGIIPGPSEPEHDINSYLQPLVNELLSFLDGVKLHVSTASGVVEKKVKCALLCVACDLPAGRKACGFLSHNARLGCSRCLKEFSGGVGNQDFSGFERANWCARTDTQHRRDVEKLTSCKSKTEKKKMESLLGCRYSVFLDLPYFNSSRFLIVDPMHNLFLGTGKRMINLWIQFNLLTSNNFLKVQTFVDNISVPSDVGRIPHKIQSGFAGFKADQFKTWITIFSIPALYDIGFSSEHLECWRHFVLACRILCKQTLSRDDVLLADTLLLSFCKRVQRVYGKKAITPNMHMHGHLKDILLDYGPVQEFWCFSFERFNGILGNQPNNNRNIEPQLLERFLRDRFANSFEFPSEFKEDFSSIRVSERLVGSVLDTVSFNTEFKVPTRSTRAVFDSVELAYLKKLYMKIHPEISDVTVNHIYTKYSSITLKGKLYMSSGKRTQKPFVALASWSENVFGAPPTRLPDTINANERPVNVQYYLRASFSRSEEDVDALFLASVLWYFPHPEQSAIGKPAQVCCKNMFESFGVHSFLPLPNLICRCAHGTMLVSDEQVLLVVPLVE